MPLALSRLQALLTAGAVLLSAPSAFGQTAEQEWPAFGKNELESVWLEGAPVVNYRGNSRTTLFSFVESCQTRGQSPFSPSPSAEWIRFAYHDMATHNVNGDGLGGLDQSIRFELDRPENVGGGLLRTLSELGLATGSNHVSFADVIAVGVAQVTASCGGPLIPFRGGRIDATEAGPAGVPEPHQTLEEHTESFRKQGFNATEMIELVACGHTLGGVRNPDFPAIVPPENPDEANATRIEFFDTTSGFDNAVVNEYLDGTTKNPLVVHANENITSDLRIFASDGNRTMENLANAETFNARCGHLFERMINTVPRGVELGPALHPIRVKVGRSFLTFNATLGLQTDIRFLTANPARQVTLKWRSRTGNEVHSASPNLLTNVPSPLAIRLGHTDVVRYWFNPTIDAATSISKFWFEVDEGTGSIDTYDNNGQGYPIEQDTLVYAPDLGATQFFPNSVIHWVLAVRKDLGPVERVSLNDCQYFDRFAARLPLQAQVELTLDSTRPSVDGFDFYTATVERASGSATSERVFCNATAVINGETVLEENISSFYITRVIFDF